jgi:hypothetical protein
MNLMDIAGGFKIEHKLTEGTFWEIRTYDVLNVT